MFSFFKLFRARTISGLTAYKPTCLQRAAQIEFDDRLKARSTASRCGYAGSVHTPRALIGQARLERV